MMYETSAARAMVDAGQHVDKSRIDLYLTGYSRARFVVDNARIARELEPALPSFLRSFQRTHLMYHNFRYTSFHRK